MTWEAQFEYLVIVLSATWCFHLILLSDYNCSFIVYTCLQGVALSHFVQDFQKSRISRTAMFPSVYNQPEDSFSQDVIATVEKSMKKYTDNLMRFLEGISSRLSQLELYCYNLDKSIGEMRSELGRDHGEADSKLKSLEKHLQEVSQNFKCLYF